MFRNNPFLIFMVYNFSLKIKSASSNICAKSSNSRWMKMAKIGLPKGSGKRLKVREKSVKSQGILKWILGGNPASDSSSFSRKFTVPMVKHICETLDLVKKGTKEEIVTRVLDFLMEPSDSGKEAPENKRKSKCGQIK